MPNLLFLDGTPSQLGSPSPATHDLGLDALFEHLTASTQHPDLGPVLHTRLSRAEHIAYRQTIFRDLADDTVHRDLVEFVEGMHRVRGRLEAMRKLDSPWQQHGWLVDAVLLYCATVAQLGEALDRAEVTSQGLVSAREHVRTTIGGTEHQQLHEEATTLERSLQEIRYRITLAGTRVTVGRYAPEPDYSAAVLATFARFRQTDGDEGNAGPDAAARSTDDHEERRSTRGRKAVSRAAVTYLNRVDAQVLDRIASLFPGPFQELAAFSRAHPSFIDEGVTEIEHALPFYLAIQDLLRPLAAAGLPLCLPDVRDGERGIAASDTYDIALADKLVRQGLPVVVNDMTLTGAERIFVVTGPNQGGKTTFSRTFGQLHHLAALGMPVPGHRVRLGVCDQIITHFERREDLRALVGKLEDELIRMHDMLERATADSVLVFNETFGSTSLRDAEALGQAALARVSELGARAVFVTFVEELSRQGPSVVSLVSSVSPTDPTVRTFKIARRAADGLAYALSLAERHGLTEAKLRRTLRERGALTR